MYRVYFARDQLPPVGATVPAIGLASREERIVQRIVALMRSGAQTPPAGSTNPAALIRQHTTIVGGFTQTVPGLAATIEGNVATVEFDIEDWGVRGAAVTQALVQQLVYTITEEPGIGRAMLVDKGKTSATIDQLVIDKPLAREDVFGYSFTGTETSSIVSEGAQIPTNVVSTKVTNDVIPGLGRFTVEVAGGGSAGGRLLPRFTATLSPCLPCRGDEGEWWLSLNIPDAAPPADRPSFKDVSGPIVAVTGPPVIDSGQPPGATFVVRVDDSRPWRVTVEPTTDGTTRIDLDVGGRPEWVNKNIAVYAAGPSAAGGGVMVRGAARVFEANVSWRVKDVSGQVTARGSTTATLGTSPVWGTFAFTATGPGTGPGTVEVYWASPRDGVDQDVIAIPLGVR